jgi:hypothetical protein
MHYLVSVPLDPGLAEFIGKRGSENGLIFYNRKIGDNTVVGIVPGNIIEKFYGVAESMLIGQQITISTISIDKLFGEVLIGASLLGKRMLLTDDNDAGQLLKGLPMQPEIVNREDVLQKILEGGIDKSTADVRIDIDRAFPVKGLGTIVLGVVTGGTVRMHDELFHPSGKKALVRSIQSQDVDVKEARSGARVGLALKGIEHDDIEKGDLLTKNPVRYSQSVRVKLRMSKISPENMMVGKQYDLVVGFSLVRATVESFDGQTAAFKLAKGIAAMAGDGILLLRDSAPRIFAGGSIVA